jgi:hypothetical protein
MTLCNLMYFLLKFSAIDITNFLRTLAISVVFVIGLASEFILVTHKRCDMWNILWAQKFIPALSSLVSTVYVSVSQPFRRRGTLDLALHISRYPLRKTSIFLN